LRLALKELGEKELEPIESLPTFYCSEIEGNYIRIKYQELADLTCHKNKSSYVSADFEVIYDFGNV
tara:strand:- start:131 stop:328 length:198 start_codon:yes stop_codon:yes gene_type:complete